MMSKIILNGLTTDELKEIVIQSLKQVLGNQTQQNLIKESPQEEFATRMEVAKFLKISLPTLHDWTKRGIVCSYKIGKRVLYKLNEVRDAMHKRNFSFTKNGGSNA